ncbi:MAG: hypothetical protein KF789_02700 [Bdellovibrionaceae bacterium]|nr:hypothetical protein [Pseudobdellovibrionaceae bacterium]
MALNHQPAVDSNDLNLRAEFMQAAFGVADFARRAGFRVVPYHDNSLPHFSRLSLDEKKLAIASLEEILSICHGSQNEGCDIKDSLQLLWFTIRHFGLKPPSNMFDHIGEGDIIAIHHGPQQIFRNFEYFEYCSYSLEELGCVDWTKLYERPEQMEKDIFSTFERSVATNALAVATVGEHIVQETFAPLRLRMGYRLKFVSPLYYKNSVTADHHLVCMQAELKGPVLTSAEEEELLNLYYRKQNLWQEQKPN